MSEQSATVAGSSGGTSLVGTAKRVVGSVGLVALVFLLASLGNGAVEALASTLGVALSESATVVAAGVLSQLAIATVAVGFLAFVADRGFCSVRTPDARELRAAGAVVLVGASLEAARQLAIRFELLEAASTVPLPEDVPLWASLAVLALAVLAAPVVEELLFRGVVQRWVAGPSSPAVGIAVATLLFVPIHAAGFFAAAGATAALALGAVLTATSIALGVAYARTDNVAVPMLGHFGYNVTAGVVAYLINGPGGF